MKPYGKYLCVETMILKWILKTNDVRVWSEFNWLRIGFSGGLL
jgi:hypothetical protein